MEFETDVRVTEDFSKYSTLMKYELIEAIVNGLRWDFEGIDTVDIEPPDYP